MVAPRVGERGLKSQIENILMKIGKVAPRVGERGLKSKTSGIFEMYTESLPA